jgi:hypothetical protein
MKNLKYILAFLVPICILQSCNPKTDKVSEEIVKNDSTETSKNVAKTILTDIDKLGKLLDFSTYKPTAVEFKYTSMDNSGHNDRISVPGPSDYFLEALLYFDSTTMEKFFEFDRYAEYDAPNFKKEEFNFDWLSDEVQKELMNSNPKYHGHPDFFFGTQANGKSWYLGNKILIKKHSN